MARSSSNVRFAFARRELPEGVREPSDRQDPLQETAEGLTHACGAEGQNHMMQYSMGMVKAKLKTSFTARPLETRIKIHCKKPPKD